jgi:hypothetical protein
MEGDKNKQVFGLKFGSRGRDCYGKVTGYGSPQSPSKLSCPSEHPFSEFILFGKYSLVLEKG